MKRDYDTGVKDDVQYFTGIEIENTKFAGLKTLFIVGCQPIDDIVAKASEAEVEHIFFGANHSWGEYTPAQYWNIRRLQQLGYKITVDCSYADAIKLCYELKNWSSDILDNLCIIAQVQLPHIEQLESVGAYIKIDDVDFKYSNSGVWVAPCNYYTNPANKTSWDEYGKDSVLQ